MIEYAHIEIADGSRILESINPKFKEIFEIVKTQISLLQSKKITSKLLIDIYDNKVRIGIDSISAEDLIVLNQKTQELEQLVTLIARSLKILLNKKAQSLVVDKENA